ncbi:MAG: hypothetical protein AB2L26_01705 [Ignavibacteria bacterium]
MNRRKKIVNKITSWYDESGRVFVWRKRSSLYKLLITEIFLWKTQANTVNIFLPSFLEKYNTPEKIVNSSTQKLKRDIKTLGLSERRAKLLKGVFEDFSSNKVPINESKFRKRFKVGQYISRSVLLGYKNVIIFPVDANIRRFFHRVFSYDISNIRKITSEDDKFLNYFIEKGGKHFFWGVLDFCALVCKSKSPFCKNCLLNKLCDYSCNNNN